jgi:hypothetical protein
MLYAGLDFHKYFSPGTVMDNRGEMRNGISSLERMQFEKGEL